MASVTFKAGGCYSLIPEVAVEIDNFIWNILFCLFMESDVVHYVYVKIKIKL